MDTTIINVSKSTGNGRSRHFFDIEMKGHHPDSVDFRSVYKSIAKRYTAPKYTIEVEHQEITKKLIDMED